MTNPEIVFEILAEGGGLKIEREITKSGEKFMYKHNEMDFSDEDLGVHKNFEFNSFEVAFQEINKYSWYQFSIYTLHLDFKEFVLNQLIDRLNRDLIHPDCLEFTIDNLNGKFDIELFYIVAKRKWGYSNKTEKSCIDLQFQFSKWAKWSNRDKLENIKLPGIYCIAVSNSNIEGSAFSWLEEINYVGMTNSINGLKGRLKQFDNTIKGKTGHGGADRFMNEYNSYDTDVDNIYVAIDTFHCDVKSNEPEYLIMMGDVAKQEYVCIAEYVKRHEELPKFNDKKNSPKYSAEIKRKMNIIK